MVPFNFKTVFNARVYGIVDLAITGVHCMLKRIKAGINRFLETYKEVKASNQRLMTAHRKKAIFWCFWFQAYALRLLRLWVLIKSTDRSAPPVQQNH